MLTVASVAVGSGIVLVYSELGGPGKASFLITRDTRKCPEEALENS